MRRAHAAIHDHGQAGGLGDLAGLVGLDAELQPQDVRADRDRLPSDVGCFGGGPKHIDDVDPVRHLA